MTTYRLVEVPGGGDEGTVEFAIAYPADAHERLVRLHLSRPSWESQDSPPVLLLTMTAPTEEPT